MSLIIRLAAAFSMVAVFIFACGVKAPPLPADVLLPDRVSDLKYRFSEEGLLVVTFKPPTKNIKGLELKDLGGFFVDRSENRLRPSFCPGCPVTYTKRIHIRAVTPPARRFVARVSYRFEDRLDPGHVYHYRVYAHDSDDQFHPQRLAALVVYYDSPSRPPDAIGVETEDQLVVLNWPPADRLIDGRPVKDLAGYNIYRQPKAGPWVKLNVDRPWQNTAFEDTRVVNGRTYYYKVRAVRQWRGTLIEGPPSPLVAATPADLTPPPPPVKLSAASVKKGISLSWSQVKAPDLAGYRVYRRAEKEAGFKRIGPELIKKILFLDTLVKPGRVYYYRVTAVDNSPAANESEWTMDVQIRYEP